MSVDIDQPLLDLLARTGDAAAAAVTKREQELRTMYQHSDGLAQRVIERTWMEYERDADTLVARREMQTAVRAIDNALDVIERAGVELTRTYDADYVEGNTKVKVETAVVQMRLLLDAIAHNLPDAD